MYLMGGKAFLFGLRVVRRVPNGVGEMVIGFQSRRLKDHIFSHIQETEQNGQRVSLYALKSNLKRCTSFSNAISPQTYNTASTGGQVFKHLSLRGGCSHSTDYRH